MQNSEWVECCKNLTKSQMSVLYYLRSLDPYGNGINIRASKIADILEISKRAVNDAIAVLVEKGYLDKSYLPTDVSRAEERVRAALLAEVGGQTEVITAVGRIDILTASEVIEVKRISDWKEALGQILAYSAFFPDHIKRIHLFGTKTQMSRLADVEAACLAFGVAVTGCEAESC